MVEIKMMNNYLDMNKKFFTAVILLLSTITTLAQSDNYSKLSDGIIINSKSTAKNDARIIKVQVVTDNILHITASPVDSFVAEKSLMVLDATRPAVKWNVQETNGIIVLSTESINANITVATGAISFTDKSGKVLLQETKGGGKTFTGTTLDGEQSYSIRQSFTSADNEALYGLGQHQDGIFNYKGTQVLLSQYNTEVAVPFLLSGSN